MLSSRRTGYIHGFTVITYAAARRDYIQRVSRADYIPCLRSVGLDIFLKKEPQSSFFKNMHSGCASQTGMVIFIIPCGEYSA